jgi:prepilin-type N-terminal cleavage/methylation domain-containing protein
MTWQREERSTVGMLKLAVSRVSRRDDGFTLVEVIVAITVFGIIIAGALVGVASVMRVTSDNSARSTATNLAAGAIDTARIEAQNNITGMAGSTDQPTVDGRKYTVKRTLDWQYTDGTTNRCSAAASGTTAQLLFLNVHIKVTWPGMGSAAPVTQETVFSPSTKINDPTLGTILVQVQSITGSGGVGGVNATIAPSTSVASNTAKTLSTQPEVTNQDGCTVAIKVTPGTYTVTLGPPSGQYRDQEQTATPTKTVVVKAGQSSGASFNYDPAIAVSMNYASNGSGALLPTNLVTSFVSTYGTYKATGTSATQYLSPIGSGYVVYPGVYDSNATNADTTTNPNSCLSTDPTMWPKASDGRIGKTPTPPVSKDQLTANVAMGLVTVTINKSDTILTAKTAAATGGDPGCKVTQSYSFARTATGTSGTTDITLALPYGTWSVTSQKNSSSAAVNVTAKGLIGVILNSGSVTLDPRVAP